MFKIESTRGVEYWLSADAVECVEGITDSMCNVYLLCEDLSPIRVGESVESVMENLDSSKFAEVGLMQVRVDRVQAIYEDGDTEVVFDSGSAPTDLSPADVVALLEG